MKNLLIIISYLILFSACKQKINEDLPLQKKQCIISPELKEKLTFDTIQIQDLSTQTELTGNVSFDLDRLFKYQSLFSGIVQNIYFNLGDFVEKGQLLAEIKSTNFSEQKSQLSIAKSALEISERNLQSIRNMQQSQLASDREVLEAEKEVMNLRSEINKINESIQIQGGNIEKGIIMIRATKTGYIVQKNITSGSYINEGDQDLFAISDLKNIWIMVNVYAAQLASVRKGGRAVIRTTAYPDEQFEGTINRLSNVFDPEEKVMKAIIELENPELKLKPDMMVSVQVFQDTNQKALAIPIQNVIFDNDAYHVVLYEDDCTISAIEINPIGKNKNHYFIAKDSEIIKENQVLITENNLLLYNELIGK